MEQNEKLYAYFKSVIDQDRAAVVICNLQHEIIYMNPAAINNYEKRTENIRAFFCFRALYCDKLFARTGVIIRKKDRGRKR